MDNEFKTPKTGQQVTIEVRCKDCYHFKKERANRYADVCSNLGILPIARPCKAYLANVNAFSFRDEKDNSLAQIINKIPSNQLALVAGLINQEKTTRRHGFRHGQVVYVRVYGDDYLNNYAKAQVMSASKIRVLVQSEAGFRGSFLRESILTIDEYARKEKVLIARKRINDPKSKLYNLPKIKNVPKVLKDYEPPTIDSVMVIEKKPIPVTDSKHIHIRG